MSDRGCKFDINNSFKNLKVECPDCGTRMVMKKDDLQDTIRKAFDFLGVGSHQLILSKEFICPKCGRRTRVSLM